MFGIGGLFVEWRRINLVIGCAIFWLLSQIYWLSLDHIVRDGDEEGHVGAAEIFKDWLVRGEYGQFTTQLFWGDLGEYPPLFAGYIGFWWWLFDAQPEDLLLRSTLLLFPLATACICAWLSKSQKGPWHVIFVIALFLPLTNGLSRHYMIENPLPTCIALFCFAYRRKKDTGASLLESFSDFLFYVNKQLFYMYSLCSFLLP